MEQPGRRESRGDEGGRGESADGFASAACVGFAGDRTAGFRRARRISDSSSARQSVAFAGPERGPGRRTHYAATHPPTRAREWVSYEANRGMCVVLDPASEPCHELPGAGDWGLWVAARSAAAHSRELFCRVNRVEVIPS